jgi:hypothetical protein
MTTRKYSSRSQQTTLSGALTSSATTTTVVSGSALAGGLTISAGELFTVVIDPDTAIEEIVDVSAISGNTLTIVRGIDGSAGVAHSAGAIIRHMAIGRDYREANTHIESITGHGTTGAVVGTTNTQTLINKTIDSASNTLTGVVTLTGTQTLTNKTLTNPTITGTTSSGTFTGNLTGNVTGNVSGNAGTVTNGVYTTDTGTITGTMIANGTIIDADINASAAIAKTKLALTGTITSTDIANDTIMDADINTAAGITKTKIAGTAVTLADTGSVTSTMIADGTIVNADINASAAIDWTKIAPSSLVSATELGYVDGVTSSIQTQIDSKLATATASSTYAPLASPALTGTPTAPTATAGTNTTQVATTAFVGTAVSNLVAAAPAALDTLNELATALGNDAAFSTTVTNSIATKLPLAGGTMSGAIAMGTNKITGVGDPTNPQDASTKAYSDLKLPLTGGTLSGALAMGANKITGVGNPTNAQDVVTKNYLDTTVLAPSNLTGPITSSGAATSIASQTGTGTKFVVDTSPTIITPTLSGATVAGTINGTTIPNTKTLVVTTDKLSTLAATTSAELAGVISDETGSGALVFGTGPTLTGAVASADPTAALGIATKQYVDLVTAGVNYHAPVMAASVSNLSANYSNGSSGVGATLTADTNRAFSTLDGQTVSVGQRILIKDQTSQLQNGIYTLTTVGSGAAPWVITRATDNDGSPELANGDVVNVTGGTVNSGKTFVNSTTGTITVGTTAITWASYYTGLPSQTGSTGLYLTTDGTTPSWSAVSALPSQTSNSGKYLTTNGTAASWASIVTDPTPSVFMLMGA